MNLGTFCSHSCSWHLMIKLVYCMLKIEWKGPKLVLQIISCFLVVNLHHEHSFTIEQNGNWCHTLYSSSSPFAMSVWTALHSPILHFSPFYLFFISSFVYLSLLSSPLHSKVYVNKRTWLYMASNITYHSRPLRMMAGTTALTIVQFCHVSGTMNSSLLYCC
jgi:hypothetical protein